MKRALLLLVLLTAATSATAASSEPILTSDGVLYTVAAEASRRALVVTARYGDQRESAVVPASEDPELDSEARLAYDRGTQTLYVVWRRGESSTEIVFVSLDANGEWSEPTVLASAPGYRQSDLQVTLTRSLSPDNVPVTFIHAAWWKESEVELIAEYGLAAVSGGEIISTSTADLLSLSGIRSALDVVGSSDDGVQPRPEPVPTYPPLALSGAAAGSVDVVFGSQDKKSFTRLLIEPRLKANARIYIPVGKGPSRVPYTKVHNSMNGQVATYISGSRVVVYASGKDFRYAKFENGTWSSVRAIPLDAAITPEQIATELRRTVDQPQY